jgi:hypothetical protein
MIVIYPGFGFTKKVARVSGACRSISIGNIGEFPSFDKAISAAKWCLSGAM